MICTIGVVILISLGLATAQPNICTPNGGYTDGSTFDVDLNAVLSTLPSNIPDSGYYAASITALTTRPPETITAFALCRGDLTPSQCRTCLSSAPPDLNRICRNQRQGVVFAEENCIVRYTDAALNPPSTLKVVLINGVNAANPAQFKADRDALLSALRSLAAGGGPQLKAGGGSRSTSSIGSESSTIFGLVQCRPDLSSGDCGACLEEATAALVDCCNFQTGVRVLKPDCTIQYEIRIFYNATRLRQRGVLLR